MLITSYKIGGVHFRLLGTNGFHVKAKNERFTAASSRCRQNLKYENFTSSFGRLRQNIAPKRVPHVQHDHFSSFNQWNHWFVALSLTMPSSNLKLPIIMLREQGWRSGDSTRLPPTWPGFGPRVGYVGCWFFTLLREVFLWVLRFSPPQKSTFPNFNSIGCRTSLKTTIGWEELPG